MFPRLWRFNFIWLTSGMAFAIAPAVVQAAGVDSTQGVLIESETGSLDSSSVDSSLAWTSPDLPFLLKEPSTKEIGEFRSAWEAALTAFRANRFLEAASRLQKLQPSEKLAQVYRTLFFAQASLAANFPRQADSALEATIPWVRGAAWQRELWTQRLKTFDFKSASGALRKDFFSQAFKAPLESQAMSELLYRWLESDSNSLTPSRRREAFRHLLRVASPDSRLDSIYRILAVELPPGKGTWEEQKLVFDFQQKLGYTQKALERIRVLLPLAPNKSEKKALQLNSAELLYRKGSYLEAIRSYQEFEETYGALPDLYLQEARAYRRLLDEPSAQRQYSRLVEMFPKSSKSMDVYWMRAFSAESAGRMEEAVETYSRLIASFPEGTQAEKASFRIGLSHYKNGDYAAALRTFQDLRRLKSSSRVLHAGLYWEGKAQQALGDSAAANQTWMELGGRFPFSYYGHLAQLNLQARNAWPDSLNWNRRFPATQEQNVQSWLAGLSPRNRSYGDTIDFPWQSVYLPLAVLLNLKMENLALLTLRSQPPAFFSNPWVLYTVAHQCQDAGLWTEAYRFGTLLGNLVPVEEWPKAPRSVLRLFYPPAYEPSVRKWALQYNVPAGFVFALMKQESGFDARVVSRVGARGLMQMMPATGTKVAKQEGVQGFTPDDLFIPDINVHLGVAYLRDLERQHRNDLYLTLAHYNAGPDALATWMPQLLRRPIDESVEDIGYSETREYVKRVLSNYWTYQALYE